MASMSKVSATHFDSPYPDPTAATAGTACSSMGSRFSRRETAAMELMNRNRGGSGSRQLKAKSISRRRSAM
jgi:hypothetical protein